MDRKAINIVILIFVLGMGAYHIIPSKFLIGRFIYYIALYGSITAFLFHLRHNSIEIKHKRYYLIASIYPIGKIVYHLWMVVAKYRYNILKVEYNFKILGVECELFAAVFSLIVLLTLIGYQLNNNGRVAKK